MINVTGFDESSIGMNILYWHASDIPTELAARSDLAIAIHQAFLAETITIAFPQVVVWGGTEKSATYGRPARVVDTPYPGLVVTDVQDRRRIAEQFRRPIKRKGRD